MLAMTYHGPINRSSFTCGTVAMGGFGVVLQPNKVIAIPNKVVIKIKDSFMANSFDAIVKQTTIFQGRVQSQPAELGGIPKVDEEFIGLQPVM